MGEPLSTAAGVVGIVVPVMHGARLLLDDINKIREVPTTLAELKKDLEGVDLATGALKVVELSELRSLGVAEELLSAIKTCDEACENFRKDLQSWTKHSKEGKLSRLDRITLGFFKDENIKSLSTRLQNSKTTLTLAVSNATLHSSIRQSGTTTEIRKQLTASEIQITAAIKSIEAQKTESEKRLTHVSLQDAGDENSERSRDKSDALRQIEEERKELSESRKVLEALSAKTKDKSNVSVTNIRMSDSGKVLAGMVNTQGRYTDARINIDNVTATTGGRAITGIVENLNITDFFTS